jgi:hypothetical protein
MRLLSEAEGRLRYIPENALEVQMTRDDPRERIAAVKNLLQGLS